MIETLASWVGENVGKEFFDRNGNCKAVSQKTVDLIQVRAQGISSLEDKEILLQDLYQQIELADAALEMLENPEEAGKVKQKKEDILRIKEGMEETRRYILNFRLQQEQYGLYIKYPPGFEG